MSGTNDSDQALRDQIVTLLRGRVAHMDLRQVVAAFPEEAMNTAPPHSTATAWHTLEHIRIALHDILQFTIDPEYESPAWPDNYWPAPEARTDPAGWERTLKSIEDDLTAMIELVQDPKNDLLAPLAHAEDYTILREALLVVDHNAYHLGELSTLRAVLDIRPDEGWW